MEEGYDGAAVRDAVWRLLPPERGGVLRGEPHFLHILEECSGARNWKTWTWGKSAVKPSGMGGGAEPRRAM